jgi:hypothetical protein
VTDIGDAITVTTEIRVDDALTDPTNVVLAVTDPTGVTLLPAPTVTHPSTGIYEAIFTATAAGRWLWKWISTDPDGVEHGHIDIEPDPPPPGRLEPLASISDLEDRIGTLTTEQAARATALLAGASARVRAYTRQNFDLTLGDVAVLRPIGAELILPQRPVLAVASVKAIPGDGSADIAMSRWEWDGLDVVKIGGFGWRTAIDYDLEWDWVGWSPDTYRVTYDHGYATTPDDVVDVVCSMVNRILTAPTMAEGMASERAGPFAYQMGQGSGTPGPAVRLTQRDKDDLADAGYRRRSGTIQVRS